MMRPLRDLLATFENWSSREVNRRVLAKATTEREREVMRRALDQGEDVDPLDVLRDVTELVSLLSGWQWQVMYAARLAGAAWDEIGAATGESADEARSHYVAALDRQERYASRSVEEYRQVV